ncbi:hypothetical protein BD410DRAFT_788655 [Rickenella mellea]|uniref:Uncharacterized protein n=1 Tax=Rickenella mellea TaxID=50990 RepID=A0A4Y7Q4S4_9AGAM|nr:hypothetical protein BD410DRAFT_788655 [Rickenella mellea]
MMLLPVLGYIVLQSSSLVVGVPDVGRPLWARGVQTPAVCLNDFAWMDNSESQSPCLVAAWLLGACQGGDFTLPALANASVHYDPPSSLSANGCYCSWAVYNTLQACAYCQQGADTSIFNWTPFMSACPSSDLSAPDPFPKTIVIPQETSIAFWATTDPSTWSNAKFDPTLAKSLALQDKPDVTQNSRNPSSKKHSVSKAAIAGGVVGGLVVFALGVLVFLLHLRKKRALKNAATQPQAPAPTIPPQSPQRPVFPNGYAPTMLQTTTPGTRPPLVSNYTSYTTTSESSGQIPSPPIFSVMTPPPPSAFPGISNRPRHGHSSSNGSNTSNNSYSNLEMSMSEHAHIEPFILPGIHNVQTPDDSMRSSTASPTIDSEIGSPMRQRLNPPAYEYSSPSGNAPATPPEKAVYVNPASPTRQLSEQPRSSLDPQRGHSTQDSQSSVNLQVGGSTLLDGASLSVNQSQGTPAPAQLRLVTESRSAADLHEHTDNWGFPPDRKA